MNGTLKIAKNYGSKYEALRDAVSYKKHFNEQDWKNIALGNTNYTLESYADVINKSEELDDEMLNQEYNFKYADDETHLAILYNEIYANRDNVDENRERYVTNDLGAIVKDENGKELTEKYQASDYDYFKSLLKERNDFNYQKWLREQEQERKDSMNGFVKFLANTAAVGTEFVYGFTKQVNDIIDIVDAMGNAAGDAIANRDTFQDSFVKNMANDDMRPFQALEEGILNFESRYTDLRDLDGNYTNVGKYLGGVSSSLGQLVPSVLLGKGLGAAGKAIGGTAGAAITASASAASQIVFYTGMTSGNIRDMYRHFALQGISVPSEQIIANAAIKSVLQWGVEFGLSKILGGSALDNLVFGRKVAKTVTGKSLATSAVKRVVKDFATEGLEEVLQDTSDFLVDRGFMYLINENFGSITELTFQSLFDAFIIGGIASFGGSAFNILGTKSKGFNGNFVQRKLAAWEYGLNIQSFVSTYDKIMKSEKYDDTAKTKVNQKYVDAMTEMYASYRIIASIYGEIGEERFNNANKILTEITKAARAGRFDNAKIRETAEDLYESVFGEQNLAKEYEDDIKKKIEEAKLAEQVQALLRGEEVDADENSPIIKAMKEFMEQKEDCEQVIATKYGENVVYVNKTAIVPAKLLENAGALVANATIKEQDLVQDIIKNSDKKYKLDLAKVRDTYKKLTGDKKATMTKAITTLLLDENLSLYRAMLVTANKDMYSFLSGLGTHLKMLSITDVADSVHKQALTNIVKRMSEALVEYLKVQPNANYQLPILSQKQIDSIKIERWANNIYSRVIKGEELSERDMNVLISRINNLPIKNAEKTTLLSNLKSVNVDVREATMKRIDGYYNNIFTTKYDGVTYMPMTSIPNMAFNNYLQNLGLTLKNWLSLNSVDTGTKNIIVNTYGEFNEQTLYNHRVNTFKQNVNNAYSVEIKGDKLYIMNDENEAVGFSNYNSKIDTIITGQDVGVKRNIQTIVEKDTKNLIAITKSLLNDTVSDVVANMITIEDILYNTDLLKDDIRNNIISEYGNTSVQNTFLYLRKFLMDSTKGISIVAKPDGGYLFVNVKPMEKMFKTKKFNITKDTKLSDIINSSYLTGILATTKIVITNEDIAAEYVMYKNYEINGKKKRVYENAIYIGKNVAEGNQDYLRFAIAHEIEHVIQFENKLSLGMNEYWLQNVKQSVKNQIITDVKKHKPDLFTEGMTNEQMEDAISKFIYHTSGESMAMGLDATQLVDFYPTMVKYTDSDTVITMPWGTTYQLKQGISSTIIDVYKSSLIKLRDNLFEVEHIKDLIDYENKNIKTLPLYDYEVDRDEDFYDNMDLYLLNPGLYNKALKYIEGPSNVNMEEFYKDLTSKSATSFKTATLKIAYNDFVKDKTKLSYDEFINNDLLYIRLQDTDVRKSNFVAVSGGITSILQIMNSQDLWQHSKLIIGTFKPKDALCYFNTNELEFLLPTDKLKDGKIYDLVVDTDIDIEDLHPYKNIGKYYEITLTDDNGKIHKNYRLLNEDKLQFIDSDTKEIFTSSDALRYKHIFKREEKYQEYDEKRLIISSPEGKTITDEDVNNESSINVNLPPDDIRMSLIKIADNLWEVEGIKDLVEVNKEYIDNVKSEFDYYSHKRKYSLDYDEVHSNDFNWGEMLKIVNTYDNEDIDYDAIELAFEHGEYYFLDVLSNNYKNIGLSEKQYHDVISVFNNGISYNDPVTEAKQNYEHITSVIGKYINYRDAYYLDKYINSLNLNEEEKEVATNIYNYVIGRPQNVYKLLITNAGKTYKEKTLRKLYNDSIIDKNKLSYDEFLNIDVPFLRSQRSTTSPSNFVSIAININNERSFINLFEHMFMNDTKWATNDVLIAGTVKLKDCLCYIDNEQNEVLLPTDKLIGTYEFEVWSNKHTNELSIIVDELNEKYNNRNIDVNIDNDYVEVINNDTGEVLEHDYLKEYLYKYENKLYLISSEGKIITDEQVTTDLGPDDVKLSLAKNIKSETKKVKNESKTEGKPKEKRYLSYAEAKGTNLEYFYKKYNKTQLSPELKKFIASTTNLNIAPELMEKINGKKAGTLTVQDVMDYFRDTDLSKIDETTFELINEAFFKNKVITTPKQLENYLAETDFYYAARVVVRGHKNINQSLVEIPDAGLSANFVKVLLNADSKTADSKLFNKLITRYRHIEKGNTSVDIDPNEKYLKTLWMRYFDGSLQTAGRVANIARFAEILGWNITGELRSKSMQESIGEDITLEDTLVDESALADLEAIVDEMSGTEKRNALIFGMTKIAAITIANKIGKTEEAAKTARNVMEMLKSLSTKDLNRFMLIKILSDTLGIDYDKALDNKLIDDTVIKTERTSWSIVNNMKSNTRTIKKRLNGAWQKKRFLKLYSDIFDGELNIKEDLYKNVDGKYKTTTELNQLWDKVREAKDAVLEGAFVSKDALAAHEQHIKRMRKLEADFLKNLNEKVGKKEVKVIQVEMQDDYLNIEATKEMPDALMQILDFSFTELVKSKTMYLTNDTDYHFRTNFKEFTEINAERLRNLTQQDVDDIIDYYCNSTILNMGASKSKVQLYNAVQLYMSTYLLRIDTINNFIISEEQRKNLTDRTELLVSSAGQLLADWRAVSEQLKPAEDIMNSLAQSMGIEIEETDIQNLLNAVGTGDVKKIEIAKQQMIENTIKKYRVSGRKANILDRLIQFQRVAMLSSPSTWARNLASNVMIRMLNNVNDFVGNLFTNKFKKNVTGQYKIIGTKVSTQINNFIKTQLIDSGLFDSINEGLNKYDSRTADKKTPEYNLTRMITKNIATNIFYNNYLDDKVSKFGKFGKFTKENINKWYAFVFKAMSDDKSVQRATIKYFGRMLAEDGIDLSHGFTNEVQLVLSNAYTLAAQDYMHKSNIFNKIEALIKNHGGTVPYFIYKQVFPFAGAAWNWFKEGLNYTPIGLLTNVVKFAKMENTIAKLEDKAARGENVLSSRLARYTMSRNIGKGVIGSIGTAIGIILAMTGCVRLDEEDDKYKLYCNDSYVDISELFGTQGIFLGLSVTQSIADGFDGKYVDDEGNFKYDTLWSVLSKGFNTLMMESNFADFWNTVRFNGDLGDYALNMPFNSLQMYVPNWYKTTTAIFQPYKVQYSSGIKGKVDRLFSTVAPWAYPKQVDVYTGEYQLKYKGDVYANGFITAYNKVSPIKISPYNVTDIEKTSVELGVNKGTLTGKYTINNKKVNLTAEEIVKLNTYYGQLNKKDLERLMANKEQYEVQSEKGKYVKLYYSKMTDKQKATVIKRIMSNNSSYAKIYVLTSKGYKYYANDSEYKELISLNIRNNVYKKLSNKEGFIEP